MLLHVALEGGRIATVDEAHDLRKEIYPEPIGNLGEDGWRSATHAMAARRVATVVGGTAILTDVEWASCYSSRTRLNRAMWKKRALVGVPTKLWLGTDPKPGNIQHVWCFKNQTTPFTLPNDLAMSPAKKKNGETNCTRQHKR